MLESCCAPMSRRIKKAARFRCLTFEISEKWLDSVVFSGPTLGSKVELSASGKQNKYFKPDKWRFEKKLQVVK